MRQRILVVASDAALRATLARWLLAAGYVVELAESPRVAREVIAHTPIALAILFPAGLDAGGADLARELASEVEQLIVIEKDASEPDVLGRVRSALTAAPSGEPPADWFLRFEGYTLDAGGRACVDADGRDVTLTRAEFSLLYALVRQPGRVLSRDELSHAAAGRGANPDDRTIDVLISRLRRKIEPDPKTPRIIITVPGEGYKLAAKVEAASMNLPAAASSSAAVISEPRDGIGRELQEAVALPARSASAVQRPHGRMPSFLTSVVGVATATFLGVAGGLAIAAWYWGPPARTSGSDTPVQQFDANALPLVVDSVRSQLSNYLREPPSKAIAISREGWGLSSGAVDQETAKTEALERCRERDKGGFCRLYAIGDNLAWPRSTLPLPLAADIRADAAGMPLLTSESLIQTWQRVWHVPPSPPATDYLRGPDHKALALSQTGVYRMTGRPTRGEAIRIAIERCSDYGRAPCLLVSVDGIWTAELPQSYRITGPFTLAGELEMNEEDRQRIAQVYAGKDWRALARGQSGRWYAVDGHQTEASGVDEVLKKCRAAEPECALHAIGNWRVGAKLDPKSE